MYAVIGSRCPRLCIFGHSITVVQQIATLAKVLQKDCDRFQNYLTVWVNQGENGFAMLVSESAKSHLTKDTNHKFQPGPVVSGKVLAHTILQPKQRKTPCFFQVKDLGTFALQP